MQEVSGISPYISGGDPSASGINNDTATGASILSNAAGKRIGFEMFNLHTFSSKVGEFFVQLDQQFIDEKRMIRIVGKTGEQWVRYQPDQGIGLWDVKVVGSSESMNKMEERQSSMELLGSLGSIQGMPMNDGTQVDVKYALIRLIESYDLEPERFFVPIQPNTQASMDAHQAGNEAQIAQAQQMMQQSPEQPSVG